MHVAIFSVVIWLSDLLTDLITLVAVSEFISTIPVVFFELALNADLLLYATTRTHR